MFRTALNSLAVVAPLFCALFAGTAAAQDGDEPQRLRFYGHFSPSAVAFEDGRSSYFRLTDNAYSGGRIGIWTDLPVLEGRSRFNFETSLGFRSSASLSQNGAPPMINFSAATVRKLEFVFEEPTPRDVSEVVLTSPKKNQPFQVRRDLNRGVS